MLGALALTFVLAGVSALPDAFAATVARKPASHAAEHAVRWGYLIGVGADLAVLLSGAVIGARASRLFVGDDNRLSTSKTIAAVWTMVVAAALIAVVYANLLDHPQALKATEASGIIGQYAVLFGGPLGAAILAKQIVTSQVSKPAAVKPPADAPQAKDLIANDQGNTDLGDFQYVLFNGVALFFVISTLLHAPLQGLPHIPDVLLGLTSVSAVGYVGKKALIPVGSITATLDPNTSNGKVGDKVTIVVAGLPSAKQLLEAWLRFGETSAGQQVVHAAVVLGEAMLETTAPDLGLAGKAVSVSVITEDGAVLAAGQYTYE